MTQTDDRVQRILSTVDAIPRGKVATYGQVAAAAGLPGRARMVGKVLRELCKGSPIPWHRVVAAGGRIAVSGTNATRQRRLLRAEAVELRAGKVRIDAHRWDEG